MLGSFENSSCGTVEKFDANISLSSDSRACSFSIIASLSSMFEFTSDLSTAIIFRRLALVPLFCPLRSEIFRFGGSSSVDDSSSELVSSGFSYFSSRSSRKFLSRVIFSSRS